MIFITIINEALKPLRVRKFEMHRMHKSYILYLNNLHFIYPVCQIAPKIVIFQTNIVLSIIFFNGFWHVLSDRHFFTRFAQYILKGKEEADFIQSNFLSRKFKLI